MKVTYFVKPLT